MAVDANGADLGPAEVAAGADLAARRGARVLLFGPAAELGDLSDGVEVIDAPVSIAKSGDAVKAVRNTPEASIVQAARAVGAGRAQALVSGGSTGALLAAGFLHCRRAHGIHRPALALPLPVPGGPVLLLDVGANDQARPEHLVQFAFMGAAFAQTVLGIAAPRVGLLSNGEESGKGTPEVVAAYEALAGRDGDGVVRFAGNVEGTGVVSGEVDVVVCDGFTGNVALKLIEGVSSTLMHAVKDVAMSSKRAMAGGLLLRGALGDFREQIDPESHGAYLLGLRRLAVVAHGRFTRRGFARAIEVAEHGVREQAIERTQTALERAGALRHAGRGQPSGPMASVGAS